MFEHVSRVCRLGVPPQNAGCRNAGRRSSALPLGKQRLRSAGFWRYDHGTRPSSPLRLREEGAPGSAFTFVGPLTVFLLAIQVMDVATGGMHTVVLLEDGTLWSAGVNDDGALGRETAVDENGDPVPDKDATHFGQIAMPRSAAPVVQLACSDSASFALTLDGSVYGWGAFRNEHGVFGFSEWVKCQATPVRVYVPGGRKAPVTKIAAGANHVVGILKVRFGDRPCRCVTVMFGTQDGGAISWGNGDQGQLGRVSLRHSRRPNIIRRTMLTPTKIAGCRSMEFSDVFCREYSTFLRATNGHFFAFGLNNCCQLAIPHPRKLNNEDTQTPESRASNLVTLLKPTWVEAFRTLNILKVAPGKDHGLAVSEAGCVYSWGVPTYGVLGRANMVELVGDTTPFPVPEMVSGLEEKTIVDVASGQVRVPSL